MPLKEEELQKLRPPEIVISTAVSDMLREQMTPVCIRLKIITSRGPCRDNWCETIRSAAAEMVARTAAADDEIEMNLNGVCVLMERHLYYSASKLRDTIMLERNRRGAVKVSGFSAF